MYSQWTKSFFFIVMSIKKTYIICCRKFIKDCFQTIGVKKLAERSRIDCVHWFNENDSVCCSQHIELKNYCPPCQMKDSAEFSKNLHDLSNIVWFLIFIWKSNNETLYLCLSFWLLQLFTLLLRRLFCKGRYMSKSPCRKNLYLYLFQSGIFCTNLLHVLFFTTQS